MRTLIDQMVKQNWNSNLKEKEPHQWHQAHWRLCLKLSNINSNRAHQAIDDGEIESEIRERDCIGLEQQQQTPPCPWSQKHINIDNGEIRLEITLAWPRILYVLPWPRPSRYFSSLSFSLSHLTSLLWSESESRQI